MEDLQKIKEFFSKPLDEVQEKYYVEPSKKGFSVLRNGNEITSFDTEEEAKQHANKLNKMKFLSKEKFNEAKSEDKVDTITMDIPLFLRMLEYSREDASQDMDLHDVTEKANALGKEKGILSMEDYEEIVGAAEEIKEVVNYSPEGKDKIYSLISQALQQGKLTKDAQVVFMKWMADPNSTEEAIIKALESITGGGNVNEGELTEANIPSNIKEFAKRKGISSLVNKVAGWAEKVGARITGGTAIGKNYNTLILDMGSQTADIYINIEDGTIELYGEPANSFPQFQKVFMDKATRDENQFRREQDLKETLVKRVMEKLSKL
jgi:hypothetical protein